MEPGQLSIFTSNHLPVLLDGLARRILDNPLAPTEREIVIVQSQGMRRWVTLGLAERLGIAAGVSLPFPATFCGRLADLVLEDEARRDGDDRFYDRELLAWRVFGWLGTKAARRPEFRKLNEYLRDDPDQVKRYQLATRIAGRFDDYQVYRPGLLLDWEAGFELAPQGPQEYWQAQLWRSLTSQSREEHLARRFEEACRVLERGRAVSGLPSRVHAFGINTLPPVFIRMLTALSRHVPVGISFVSPTYHYWGDLRSKKETRSLKSRLQLRPGTEPEEGNVLLASLGKQGRDLFNLLQDADPDCQAWHELEFRDPGTDTALHALQSDILHLVERGSGPGHESPLSLERDDDSLRVHSCTSPMREMEVLRDQLLDAFARDPSLRPHDVVVLVPDIAAYAPYVTAVFGVEHEGTPALPYHIADRSVRSEHGVVAAFTQLMDVAAGRLEAVDVLDLLEQPAVRRTFGIAEGDLPVVREWVRRAGIRWGIDGEQRHADFDLPNVDANGWRIGIDRLLLGYGTGPIDGLADGTFPCAEPLAGEAELLGSFAEFAEALIDCVPRLRRQQAADAWHDLLLELVDRFLTARGDEEEQSLQLLRDGLARLGEARELAGLKASLSFAVVREHLEHAFAADSPGSGFITGRMTFCALKPMRSIPFRVVCIAGLNDGDFPRRDHHLPFDLIGNDPRLGDRSLRGDDRHLFLETLLSAQERLIITYVGRSQKDHSECAPSVCLSELLDAVDLSFVWREEPPRARVVVDHPLHPFSPAYFEAAGEPFFSYSRENCRAGLALIGAEGEGGAFIDAELPERSTGPVISLDELQRFWVHPCRWFCQQSLGIRFRYDDSFLEDAEPFALDALERYQLHDWLLSRRLGEDASPKSRASAELAMLRDQGTIPPGSLSGASYDFLVHNVDGFCEQLVGYSFRQPREIRIAGDGWQLAGRLDGLADEERVQFRLATLKAKDKVRAWILHLALNAWAVQEGSNVPRQTRVIGVDAQCRFPALEDPLPFLDELVAGYREGLRRPLPVFERTSHDFVVRELELAMEGSKKKTSAFDKAAKTWQGSFLYPGEVDDSYIELCFRDCDPLEEHRDEFEERARALWLPLLTAIQEPGP